MTPQTLLDRSLDLMKVDFAPRHRQPSGRRIVVATVLAIAASLVAGALLVAIGTRIFPSTKGYVHFAFGDYAKLTVIGIVVAALAWPVVTRVSSAPRSLFLRSAILVTLVLLLPDVWLLVQGESPPAVFVLVWMHLAIAVITYNALVRLAPVGSEERRSPFPARSAVPATDRRAGQR